MSPAKIGFKSGSVEYVKEDDVPKATASSLMDTETIPRLEEYKTQVQADPIAQTVLDSYIQLYAMGMIEVTFDEVTGEPVAELIKSTTPQFNISVPSLGDTPSANAYDKDKPN